MSWPTLSLSRHRSATRRDASHSADAATIAGDGEGEVGGIAVDQGVEVRATIDLAKHAEGAIEPPRSGIVKTTSAGRITQLTAVVLDRDRAQIAEASAAERSLLFADRVQMRVDAPGENQRVGDGATELSKQFRADFVAMPAGQSRGDLQITRCKLDRLVQGRVGELRVRLTLDGEAMEMLPEQVTPRRTRRTGETHRLTARTNRWQLSLLTGADQDDDSIRRRFLESFEQAVGAFFVEEVSVMQDGDFTLTLHRAHVHVMTKTFLQPSFDGSDEPLQRDQSFVLRLGHLNQVGVRRSPNLNTIRALAARVHRGCRIAAAQHRLGQQQCRRGLADPWRTDKQQTATEPSFGKRASDGGADSFVADQIVPRTRKRVQFDV